MAIFKTRNVFDRLEDLLDRERNAVLKGDFAELETMFAEKELLLAAVLRQPSHSERLQVLKDKTTQNQKLLNAAGRGIRAVSNFLKTLTQTDIALKTYDQCGHRESNSKDDSSLERRA